MLRGSSTLKPVSKSQEEPAGSPFLVLLFFAAIVVFLYCPKKLPTLGRMVLAFVATAQLIMIPAALARRGAPQMWGRMAFQISLATPSNHLELSQWERVNMPGPILHSLPYRCSGFFSVVPAGTPEPSLTVWMASTRRFSKRSTSPLGQRTCTQSILLAEPRPKWTRMSLFEM